MQWNSANWLGKPKLTKHRGDVGVLLVLVHQPQHGLRASVASSDDLGRLALHRGVVRRADDRRACSQERLSVSSRCVWRACTTAREAKRTAVAFCLTCDGADVAVDVAGQVDLDHVTGGLSTRNGTI